MSSYEIDAKVKELRELHDLDAEVRAEIAAIEDLLKAEMTERGTGELSGQECAVRWKTILSSRFDSAAFKLSHADLFRPIQQGNHKPQVFDHIRGGTSV